MNTKNLSEPCISLPINFIYHIECPEEELSQRSRSLFAGNNRLSEFFGGDDARFGVYCSQDYFGGRLKLGVRPAKRVDGGGSMFSLEFNFHRDIAADNPVGSIVELLATWDQARSLADGITNAVAAE